MTPNGDLGGACDGDGPEDDAAARSSNREHSQINAPVIRSVLIFGKVDDSCDDAISSGIGVVWVSLLATKGRGGEVVLELLTSLWSPLANGLRSVCHSFMGVSGDGARAGEAFLVSSYA